MALLQLGRSLEGATEYPKALEVYQQAIQSMVETKDSINFGSVLHHIGNCNAYLNLYKQSFEAYVEAAECFSEIGAVGHLSNSLSELGYLLIDYDPGGALDQLISSDSIESGLTDALMEAKRFFSADVVPLRTKEAMTTLRKIFGMASLVSFTRWRSVLVSWADALREETVRPLADQLNAGIRSMDKDGLALIHLDITTALIGSIPDPEREFENDYHPPLAKIAYLASLCYRLYDWGWKALRVFDWLAAYLSRCHGVKDIRCLGHPETLAVLSSWIPPTGHMNITLGSLKPTSRNVTLLP